MMGEAMVTSPLPEVTKRAAPLLLAVMGEAVSVNGPFWVARKMPFAVPLGLMVLFATVVVPEPAPTMALPEEGFRVRPRMVLVPLVPGSVTMVPALARTGFP